MTTEEIFPLDLDKFIGTLAGLFTGEGNSQAVAVLANSVPKITIIRTDYWDGYEHFQYGLSLEISPFLYSQVANDIELLEEEIVKPCQTILRPYAAAILEKVWITPFQAEEDWRGKALAWLVGSGVNNQGRVRSDNVAPKTKDGLLFRSQQEIYLYEALLKKGVSFAPLPVFIRGGSEYKRIEPDFVILKAGIFAVIEVDGGTHTESPAEAYDRTALLDNQGARVIRVKASECNSPTLADSCATRIIQKIAGYREAR